MSLQVYRFCRAMLCTCAAYNVMRCPSVRPSATFVDSVKRNKRSFSIFHYRIATCTVLDFHTKLYGNILTGTFLTGVSSGVGTNAILGQHLAVGSMTARASAINN